MKKIFTLLSLLVSLNSFSQKDTVFTYTNVIMVDNAKQNDLFSNARNWVDNNFKNSKAVISFNDKEGGELAGKGIMDLMIGYMGRNKNQVPVSVQFQFNIRVKNGKYKYEFTNFEVIHFWGGQNSLGILRSEQGNQKFAGTKKWNEIAYEETKEQASLQTKLLIASLEDEMRKKNDF